jgi:hypothetical protein
MLQPKVITITRSDAVETKQHWAANPLTLNYTPVSPDTLTSLDSVTAELLRWEAEEGELALETVVVTNPSASPVSLAFTSEQMNQAAEKDYRLVIYGLDGTQFYIIQVIRLHLEAHCASRVVGSSDGASVYATEADLLELEDRVEVLESTPSGGVTFLSGALSGFDDADGAVGNFHYDEATGVMSMKISVSPHRWVSWQTVNSN